MLYPALRSPRPASLAAPLLVALIACGGLASETDPDRRRVSAPAPEPETSTGTETETESETDSETESESESGTASESETGTESETETETGTESESETGTETETGTDPGMEAETDPGSGAADAAAVTDIRNYIFGHSLLLHNERANVPRFLAGMASAAGRRYRMTGRYGFMDTYADELPPRPMWGVPGVATFWDDDDGRNFRQANPNVIVMTEANFRQYYPPTRAEPDGAVRSTLASTLTVIDYIVRNSAETPRILIYENWPEMANYTEADFERRMPSASELRRYWAYTRGEFHEWWVAYQDAVRRARPGVDVDMVPVGPILGELLTGVLADVSPRELYEDSAPHGRPTLYFLASLITYAGMVGERPPADYRIPDDVAAPVRTRYRDVVQRIWTSLQRFDAASPGGRVW